MANPFIRFTGAAVVTLAAVAAACAWPAHALWGSGALPAMGLAAAVSIVGAVLGFLPTALLRPDAPLERRAQASLVGLGLRMLLTLVAVLVVLQTGAAAHATAFAATTGVFYLALLALETVLLVRAAKGTHDRVASA